MAGLLRSTYLHLSAAHTLSRVDLPVSMASQLFSPMQGTVLLLDVQIGDDVAEGQRVAILESMKMEHEISTSISGTIEKLFV